MSRKNGGASLSDAASPGNACRQERLVLVRVRRPHRGRPGERGHHRERENREPDPGATRPHHRVFAAPRSAIRRSDPVELVLPLHLLLLLPVEPVPVARGVRGRADRRSPDPCPNWKEQAPRTRPVRRSAPVAAGPRPRPRAREHAAAPCHISESAGCATTRSLPLRRASPRNGHDCTGARAAANGSAPKPLGAFGPEVYFRRKLEGG